MILLDSNVLSGLIRAPAEPNLIAWFRRQRGGTCLVSAVSCAEIAFGIARLPAGRRKQGLDRAFEHLVAGMTVVMFDAAMATVSASFRARRERAGRPLDLPDAMIAATASVSNLDLITRNTRDFQGLGLTLIDPWTA